MDTNNVMDLNELAQRDICDAYVQAFGPLPEEIMMNDINYHVRELIMQEGKAYSAPIAWIIERPHHAPVMTHYKSVAEHATASGAIVTPYASRC